ncbi:2-dehydropantoate 2-reductase [Acidisoma silvae]|uniref:2-dehydropantoate 2-reductase n=1 Tax=Acidisoma silvae TaxID=2802396 RepID=A0A964E139_9PROT|nr:2-dehydropantoate 2-reductase [Acidisoma silvae]MCB8877383.1 2-dehydropantoate 2-reductase [Acidisoma silvae]
MKICIFGAGAIGGYLAVELSLAGHNVSVIARGAHLAAIQQNGLTLLTGDVTKHAEIEASDNSGRFGPQDLVISALKAHQAHASVTQFLPLLGKETPIVAAVNGIPLDSMWYFYKTGGPFDGLPVESVDAGGRQWTILGPERAIGCVIDPACEVITPGIIKHTMFNRFTLGEPDGTRSERVRVLSKILSEAGFDAPIRDNIRWNVWLKLWGNVCFNPISALTYATLDRITTEAGLLTLCKAMMAETQSVNEAHGIHIPHEMADRRLAAAGLVIGHKMSMLQDLERGRSMEIDALVTSVQELGRLAGLRTPLIDTVLSLIQERARTAGLYPTDSPKSSSMSLRNE